MTYKVDADLGSRVAKHLASLGIETPTKPEGPFSAKQNAISDLFAVIMDHLGLDLRDDSLRDTPKRVSRMFCQEIFYGLDYSNFPKCTTVENKMHYEEMISGRSAVHSMCEHHFVPFIGDCWLAYIPDTKVLGLSKMNRIVDFFSRRPQIQERLTEQIHAALTLILETRDVAVVVKAKHFCVHIRGVKDQRSETVTSKISGKFRSEGDLRNEFLSLTRNGT